MRAFVSTAVIAPPFPPQVSPYQAMLAAASAGWAAWHGLTPARGSTARLRMANAAELAARAGPDADPAGLRLLSDLITWLFALDDSCDEDGLGADPDRLSPLLASLLEVLHAVGAGLTPGGGRGAVDVPPDRPGARLAAALHDLCRRVHAQGRPGTLPRFTAPLHHYLSALVWEATNRQQGRVPTVAEYIPMRRHAGAVLPSFALTDLAGGGLPYSRHRVDPRLAQLNTVAADLVCWCNDLFSYAKEQGRDPHNLAVVIAHETGQDSQAALAEAANRFNDGLALYLRLEQEVLATTADPTVSRFTATRRRWIRGTYDWSMNSGRYR